jgi:2-polyprenyl-3-methyl-5-hydroxy-6-metoxy-1,4-benzoquinol methylase
VQFEEFLIRCPICSSSKIFFWKHKTCGSTKHSIYICKKCSGGFLNPRPSDDALRKIYNISGHGLTEKITCNDVLEREKEFPNSIIDAKRIVLTSKSLYQNASQKNRSDLKLLDIGSGFGFFSLCAIKSGFEVVSINPGEYENLIYAELFNKNGYKANIQVGMFEDFKFAEESFDVVIASQVLEHVKYPREMISEIEKILKPNGILAIAVPNFHSLFVKLLGTRDRGCLWVPEHCNYFTKKSLLTMIEGKQLRARKIIDIAKIPYFTLSNRLSLKKGSLGRAFLNDSFKIVQYPFCRGMEFFGVGNYINLFLKKSYRD